MYSINKIIKTQILKRVLKGPFIKKINNSENKCNKNKSQNAQTSETLTIHVRILKNIVSDMITHFCVQGHTRLVLSSTLTHKNKSQYAQTSKTLTIHMRILKGIVCDIAKIVAVDPAVEQILQPVLALSRLMFAGCAAYL